MVKKKTIKMDNITFFKYERKIKSNQIKKWKIKKSFEN